MTSQADLRRGATRAEREWIPPLACHARCRRTSPPLIVPVHRHRSRRDDALMLAISLLTAPPPDESATTLCLTEHVAPHRALRRPDAATFRDWSPPHPISPSTPRPPAEMAHARRFASIQRSKFENHAGHRLASSLVLSLHRRPMTGPKFLSQSWHGPLESVAYICFPVSLLDPCPFAPTRHESLGTNVDWTIFHAHAWHVDRRL